MNYYVILKQERLKIKTYFLAKNSGHLIIMQIIFKIAIKDCFTWIKNKKLSNRLELFRKNYPARCVQKNFAHCTQCAKFFFIYSVIISALSNLMYYIYTISINLLIFHYFFISSFLIIL